MISGHRRLYAAGLAGLETIPAIVRNMTDDEAIIFMVNSNLQRETILPSERAKAYKMKMDAIKRQGSRTDLSLIQMIVKSICSCLAVNDIICMLCFFCNSHCFTHRILSITRGCSCNR